MKFLSLILKSARRSKRRTILTALSVAVAVFLFAALRAVLDGFNAGAAGSSSTRLITIRSTSLIFAMPESHATAIRGTQGVDDLSWANWFGGIYKDPQNFFAQFAVDPESYLRLYPEIVLTPEEKQAFLEDRTGAIVGQGLARTYDFKVGDRIVLQVGIPIYGTQDFTFTIRGIYRAGGTAVDNQSMMFHWKYADERALQKGQVGWYVMKIDDPDRATAIAAEIDSTFANTPFETKTETEQQFQATFASMFGNLNLLLGSIAFAVVLTTLFVAANTMAMSVRERTTEIAVMRTLGFPSQVIFLFIAGEGLFISLLGGVAGAVMAVALVDTARLGIAGGFVPAIAVSASSAWMGIGISAIIGVVAGTIPAVMASRLKIVNALRRVA
jgi:putative ABC transport system permease protein